VSDDMLRVLCVSAHERRARRSNGSEVVHVVAHGDEEVEEELAALLHLDLHGATSLEGVPASNDESKVVSTKF